MTLAETETLSMAPSTLSMSSLMSSVIDVNGGGRPDWSPEPERPKTSHTRSRRFSSSDRGPSHEANGHAKTMMDYEDTQEIVPVRPKTTHVRMGRQNQAQNNEEVTASEERVERPKTTQVRMPRTPSVSASEAPEGLRPSWSSDPVTVKPKLSSLRNGKYASNEALNQEPLTRPRTSRLGRQSSSDSLNRVAFSTHFDPPNWSIGSRSASRRMSRSETPNYIEVFRASSSLGQAETAETAAPPPPPVLKDPPSPTFPKGGSWKKKTTDPPPFATDFDPVIVRPRTTHVSRSRRQSSYENAMMHDDFGRPDSPIQMSSSTSIYQHPRIVKSFGSTQDRDGVYYNTTNPRNEMSNIDVNGSVSANTRPPSRLNPAKATPSQTALSPRNETNYFSSKNETESTKQNNEPRIIQVAESQTQPMSESRHSPMSTQQPMSTRNDDNDVHERRYQSVAKEGNHQNNHQNQAAEPEPYQHRNSNTMMSSPTQQQPQERPMSRMSYSRHFNNDRRSSNFSIQSNANSVRGLRPSTSLSLLPLMRSCADAGQYQTPGLNNNEHGDHEWDLASTSQRAYKYWNDGFSKARSRPFRHHSTLKIAVEGNRYFEPENQNSYVKFSDKAVRSARPPGEPPRHATHLLGPFPDDPIYGITPSTISADKDNSFAGQNGTKVTSGPTESFSTGRCSSNASMSLDSRFSEGTTTASVYKNHYAAGRRAELLAAKPLRPWSSSIRTGVEGDFSRQVSSKEHFPDRPHPPRVMPDVRRPSLAVPGFNHTFTNDTTYHTNVENVMQFATFSPSKRFDSKYRIPDQIDWM